MNNDGGGDEIEARLELVLIRMPLLDLWTDTAATQSLKPPPLSPVLRQTQTSFVVPTERMIIPLKVTPVHTMIAHLAH